MPDSPDNDNHDQLGQAPDQDKNGHSTVRTCHRSADQWQKNYPSGVCAAHRVRTIDVSLAAGPEPAPAIAVHGRPIASLTVTELLVTAGLLLPDDRRWTA